ncbi:hypothetical protein Hanom_Chr02g00174691 [Helianthus anomalus]
MRVHFNPVFARNSLLNVLSKYFFERPTNLSNGPKPVNTRPKARRCGEVKPAQFKDRTSDHRLLA